LKFILGLICVAGAYSVHQGQLIADPPRRALQVEEEFQVKPSGDALHVAAMGYDVHLADLIWVRSVLMFGTYWSETSDPRWTEWLGGMIGAATTLDPNWRTLYSYGGLMLKVLGDYESANRVFIAGSEAFPDDYFMKFSVAMNYHFFLENPEEAYRWATAASEVDGAPLWYGGAALAFYAKEQTRAVGIRFLLDQLQGTNDPNLIESIRRHLDELLHDDRSERLTSALVAYREMFSQMPVSISSLVEAQLLDKIPEDPYGEGWVFDVDGMIYSQREVGRRVQLEINFERQMLQTLGL
jgi:hypothetical protein